MHDERRTACSRSRLLVVVAAFVVPLVLSSCENLIPGRCKVEPPDPAIVVPDSFLVRFTTNRGAFDVIARKAWSPIGVSRFYKLVESRHYDANRFFRVLKGFVAQFGLSGDPAENEHWRSLCMADEPVKHQNERGTISFARGSPNTRSTQLFVNLADNTPLDSADKFGFPPIAQVVSGLGIVDSLYAAYGERAPKGGSYLGHEGPTQDSIMAQGNAYLLRGWPKLDYIDSARVVQAWPSK